MTRRGTFQFICFARGYAASAHGHSSKSRSFGPAVRNLVEQYRIPTDQLPTGPRGFILKGDVLKFIRDQQLKPATLSAPLPPSQPAQSSTKQKSTAAPIGKPGPKNSRGQVKYFDLPVSAEAKNAALRSLEGKAEIPHAYAYANCTVDAALDLVSGKKIRMPERLTLTDVIIRAVTATAQRTEISGVKTDNNSDVAVQFYNEGLLSSCILRKANSLGIKDIAKKLKETQNVELAELARVPFRVVSLIGSKLDQITEILSPDQRWVVSIGDAMVRVDAQSKASSKIVTLALSYDAALISDEEAVRFLNDIKSSVERPIFILVGRSTDSTSTE
ncbi:putative Pyruvate dehydrogenase protein X component, mitochondrial [Hypsibius exemplaris]|uniref:Pyruvate dehydrogenase protein X component, mitochondrial n=1 Tax=Hypsibius exemplaris TaxID=2072580 RepID=A0A1W0X7T5_HYPEX|nr:putative Pyruvate dehydrogenase protein X component, mitochondrial [Hypsibius exemplaris]